MGFGDFIKNQFLDVIEFVDDSSGKILVSKFTRQGDEIKQGAQLIVRNGQAAVFVHRGQIADVFGPGNYKLNTENLPLLSALAAFPYLLNSPIKSDLYFINTTQFINNRWGTKNPILKRDMEIGIVRITAFGSFAFRIADPKCFMTEVFGARNLNMTRDIIQYLVSFVGEAIAQCLGESNKSVLDLATNYRQLSSMILPYINEKSRPLGIDIVQASIENMDTFIQYQSARAIRDAAQQEGGLAGLGAGAVVGATVAKSMNESLDKPLRGEADFSQNDNKEILRAGDIADKIAKYKELLDNGVLTQEEYDEVKTLLLKEIS